jgi:hypothetical protein
MVDLLDGVFEKFSQALGIFGLRFSIRTGLSKGSAASDFVQTRLALGFGARLP